MIGTMDDSQQPPSARIHKDAHAYTSELTVVAIKLLQETQALQLSDASNAYRLWTAITLNLRVVQS